MESKVLPKNEHIIERGIRVAVGLGALALVFVGPQSAWGLLGLIPLATGIVGSCPVYTLLGLSTCPTELSRLILRSSRARVRRPARPSRGPRDTRGFAVCAAGRAPRTARAASRAAEPGGVGSSS
ncbi:MAG: DUF2892 domain-containing protein [Myxococcales bacterium]|nr:DUF2892 domain-containing protein [Myxococcales bacterium]